VLKSVIKPTSCPTSKQVVNISIAISTLNRAKVLKGLLSSILKQSLLPKEIIVVDDSNNQETKNLFNLMAKEFYEKKIEIKYVRGKGHGVTEARNIGIEYSSCEIHCSLDDDVILDKDYIKEILEVYAAYPNASGVAGHIKNIDKSLSARSNAVNRVFPSFFIEKDKCIVLPTGISYPYPLTRIINCEWLSGTNCSYKRKILGAFKWDENLKKYGLCDDMDISYRIQKAFPDSLYMTPYAKLIHKHSALARISNEYRTHMEISYHSYFFFKNMKQTTWNIMSFFYGIFVGRFIHSILTWNGKSIIFTIKAQSNLLRNFKEIKDGIFTSFELRKNS
jgi:glucosyl-dolichyl phosphate glucuronosyltransferase